MGIQKASGFKEVICASVGYCRYDILYEIDQRFPFYEIRVDLIDFETTDVELIITKLKDFLKFKKNKCVVTCREGSLSSEECFKILKSAIENGADFIDVDLGFQFDLNSELRKLARRSSVKYISSFHNYKGTDELEFLKKKVNEAFEIFDPDFVKIATFVTSKEEMFTLLQLCEPKIIIVGMGEIGRLVRLFSIIFGSPFTYSAALQPTAPYQPSYDELLKLLEDIENYSLGALKNHSVQVS
ncbi:MAG: type I 3-dehydroquinate dehydratase [Fervidobacterium sp.]|nr:type I 3-dehydroquinate dehydratase [Fervidobacterium sp.]